MEFTGCYYYGIYFALRADKIRVLLLNSTKSRRFNSHKTDERDTIWLLKLAGTRLIEELYVPDDKIFELRIPTRRRMKIIDAIANLKKSLVSVLEVMGVKIRELSRSDKSSSVKRFFDDILLSELGKYRSKMLPRSSLESFRNLALI